jgi:hypothetical protein
LSVWQVRAEILRQAEEIREHLTPESQGGRFCMLMIDGVTAADRSWVGVCLATLKGISFLRILTVHHQTGVEIATGLLEVVDNLHGKGFRVVAVVTDNASNEIAAIRELNTLAELQAKDILVFRIPCLSHTADLALKDALKKLFPGRKVFKDMTALRKALAKPLRGKTKKIPNACATRWLSLGRLVSHFVRNRVQIEGALRTGMGAGAQQAEAMRIWRLYDFKSLYPVLETLDAFIRWTENEHATMAQAWDQVIGVLQRLRTRIWCPFNSVLYDCFWSRMTETADLPQLILSYLLTLNGLRWYKGLPPRRTPGQPAHLLDSKKDVREFVHPLVRHFADLFVADYDIFDRLWVEYLDQTDTAVRFSGSMFWRRLQSSGLPVVPGQRHCPCFPLADMALILLHAPVSESSVERIFSILREIFGTRSQAMKEDLVEARLTLMFQDRRDDVEFCQCYDKWKMYIDSPVNEPEE